jgi:general secretion pathway protein A
MYTEYYGLREKPFELVPNPRYLYPTRTHREVLAALTYGVKAQKGFLLLSGQPGSGKTTILRHLLRILPSQVRTAFLFNTELTYEEFLRAFLRELSISYETASREEMILALNTYLLAEYRAGNSVLLIIDEAQNLNSAVLEDIRMLSNLETDRGKPLQILLVGQPDLWRKVNQPELQQLGQRITVICHLGSLTPRETCDYITHRLCVAGRQGGQLFTRSALRQVHRRSMGNPRLINVICDEALLYGFMKRKQQVSRWMITSGIRLRRLPQQAAAGTGRRMQPTRALERHRYAWGALGVVMLMVALPLATTFTRDVGLYAFVSRAKAFFWQKLAGGERLPAAAQGQTRMRLDHVTMGVDSGRPSTSARVASAPLFHSLLEDDAKPVSPTGATRQHTGDAEPALRTPKEATGRAFQTNALHEVRSGETLAAVAMAWYGRSDPMVLNLLRRHNPVIVDINVIVPGWRLGIPSLTPFAWVRRLAGGDFGVLVLTTPSGWEASTAVRSLGREGLHVKAEPIRVTAQTEWFEVLVVGLASAEEAARIGALYQK